MDVHLALFIVTAENTRIAIPERDNCAIENTVGRRNQITWDDRIGAVSPDDI
jgi:hypothetical protein